MNNNNDNDNTMDNNSNDSRSILLAEAALRTPAQKRQPANSSALYKLAARNLREYHGVPSMTPLKLEKTVALLGLAPRRMVVQGLAPRRLLKGGKGGSSPMVLAGDSSDDDKEELREAEAGALVDENLTNNDNTSSSEDEEEEEEAGQEDVLFSDDSNSTYDDNGDSIDSIDDNTQGDIKADGNGNGKTRRPIHAALVAGGISLRPRETRPLLCALGVSPRRLVKLGLVKRGAIRTMAGGRGGGRNQHLRTGGPGKRGVGGPRGPSRGPPHSLGGPSSRCGPSRPMQLGPRRRLLGGAGRHTKHVRGEESGDEESMSARLGPGPHAGPEHHGPRHHGRRVQGPPHHGPGHHSMPTGRHGRGPPGGGKHGHGHRHPPNGHGHGHDDGGLLLGEGEGEGGGERLHASARGPGHRGPRHRGREGMGRSRGRPQGPPRGPPDGPFHGLFHEEGAPGAPPGMMAHPRHGSPSRGGCGMKQHGGRHGGGKRFCGGGGRGGGGRGGGGGGGGGGPMRHGRMAHLAYSDGRQQPQLEVY